MATSLGALLMFDYTIVLTYAALFGVWCGALRNTVLAGLLANTLLGWWWLDPVVAVGIAGLAVREGIEAWHGEECGC